MSDYESNDKKQEDDASSVHQSDEKKVELDDNNNKKDEKEDGGDKQLQTCRLTPAPLQADNKDILEDEATYKILQSLPFYHGFLPREDLRSLLRNDGDYLLRVSEVTLPSKKEAEKEAPAIKRDLILSVYENVPAQQISDNPENVGKANGQNFEGKMRNMVVRRYGGKFAIESNLPFDSITELLAFYNYSNTSENKKNRFLKNPIKLHSWEYRHTDIALGQLLGEGAYGEVRTGILKRKNKEVEVAVKLMKGTADLNKVKIREMMKEARLMRAFKHKNVVRFYGVAVDEQPLYIILELVRGGALNTYLQKNKKVTTVELMNMCLGAALGLQYLHANNCIHRDIAARNCLYSNDKVVKLSDFGLSRIGNSYKLCTSQKLPIKWLAAETITTLFFTFKTDVYSYGVMCFEIFSEGEEPWDGITNTEAKRNVVSGKHLTIPDTCPEKFRTFIYEKIYVKDPKRRVTMDDVARFIEPIINELTNSQRSEKRFDKSDGRSTIISTVSAMGSSSNKSRTAKRTDTKKRKNKREKTARRSSHPGNHSMIEK
ncbi:unnamed protein product [Caenorhabditis bovis]|uniref:Tyrosine-protein kinase n=1 Tax=Caenorhabditis bovis TaxID=2654633 RepID=A0A8S1F8I3_9PELO|nr:unnamed protein product [Caenorhabditis bovis]